MDNIKDFEFKEIDNHRLHYPHGYFQTDKFGRPIYIEKVGLVDIDKLFENTTPERF